MSYEPEVILADDAEDRQPRPARIGRMSAFMGLTMLAAGMPGDPLAPTMAPAGGESRRKQRRRHHREPEGVTVTRLPNTAPGPRPYRKDPVTGLKRRAE